VAHCVSGQVWLSYNEVLTDKETARGLTLTCTGHPVGGDVVLDV
jgi:ring-1,2-phenylacetyl-CoA epoxidase subunit PaaE